MKAKKAHDVIIPHQEIVEAIDRLPINFKKYKAKHHTKRREVFSEGLISLANLSFASLFFGQAFGGLQFNILIAVAGIMSLIVIYFMVYTLLKETHAH